MSLFLKRDLKNIGLEENADISLFPGGASPLKTYPIDACVLIFHKPQINSDCSHGIGRLTGASAWTEGKKPRFTIKKEVRRVARQAHGLLPNPNR